MSKRNDMGWKVEMAITTIILVLTALWVVFANKANAGDYQGTWHAAPKAEKVIKQEGMAMYRLIDGPVRCYWVVKEVRMIGAQVSLSCVIPDKEKNDDEQKEREPAEGQ